MEEKKEDLLRAFKNFIDEVFPSTNEKFKQMEEKKEKKDKVLTFNEVCSHFKISQTTLERRIRAGLKYSQAVKKGNRLFKLSDCENFFNLN